jgi:apolipoprotein N-acyltransferase
MRQIDAEMATAESLSVGLVQPDFEGAVPADSLSRHKAETAALHAKGADLVLWSEVHTVGMLPARRVGVALADSLGAPGVTLVLRADLFQVDASGERFTNAALALAPNGRLIGRQDKRNLVPFAEWLPGERLLPALRGVLPRAGRYSAGSGASPFSIEIRGRRSAAAVLLCYDDIFPSTLRALSAASPPEIILGLSNEADFGRSAEVEQHFAVSVFRSVEHRRFFLRAANTGRTAIIDAAGRIVHEAPLFVSASLTGEARLLTGRTLYGRVGDWPYAAVVVIAAGMALTSPRRRNREPMARA